MQNHVRLLILALLLAGTCAKAQTKVFKEVADDISSQTDAITQDGKLVGYLVFTTLEKASADSFNYRLSIMDENLNDIGTVSFRQEKLYLKAVSFEQDVLCLAYVQSNFVGKEFKNGKEFRRESANARVALFTQFINLNGKIVGSYTIKMDIKPESEFVANSYHKVVGNGKLKQSIQLRNISGHGFACFYGDDTKNNLLVFNTAARLTWQKQVREDATGFVMLTSGTQVDLLEKLKDGMKEGGYQVVSFNSIDSTVYPKFLLKDRKGNELKVLGFDNDPVTGKPFVSGMIIDPNNGNNFTTGRSLIHGPYCGVFSISLNGHTKKDIQASFTYWADGSQSIVDKHGYFEEARSYANVENSFRDFQGNTWFAASGVYRKVRWGGIAASTITLPLVFPPIFFMAMGTHKYSSRDVLLIKQDPAGKLSLETTVPAPRSEYVQALAPLDYYDPRNYYTVSNSETHTDYLIVDNVKNIDIYNINQKRVARSIPHKEGNSLVTVFPAKEGSVMVYEYNKKEKTTRLSIESL
jgi:hypothetical protein